MLMVSPMHAERMFAETVWLPSFGHFDDLHPQYEIFDYKDGSRFLDFAFIRLPVRVAIEIDGYGPHMRHVSREQLSDQTQRQNHLVIDGWRVLRFTYDDVKEKPRYCQQTLQQLMGRFIGEAKPSDPLTCMHKEILRMGLRLSRPITARDVCEHLSIESKWARNLLRHLAGTGMLLAVSGEERIRSYRINPEKYFEI